MRNASVKKKAVACKVVLGNDLLSKVEIAEDFPLRDETALILLRFREQFRMTVSAEAMLVEPHTAFYKPTLSEISLYGPRSYNKANMEFLRTRLENFEARGLIKKAGPEVTQASPVLIVRNAKKDPRFVVDLRSLSPLLEMQCRALISVKDQMRFTKQGRW